jgi:hypothetical protein
MGESYFAEEDYEFMARMQKKFPKAEIQELFTLECDDDYRNMKVTNRKPVGWNRTDENIKESLSKYFVEGEE